MKEHLKKSSRILFYTLFFIFTFVFFVYLTFPYGVLKEALTAQIGKATGMTVRIEEFGPSLPLGFKAKGVRLTGSPQGPVLAFDRIEVSVSVLRLFIGGVGAKVELVTPGDGHLSIRANLGILGMIKQEFLPKYVEVIAKKFDLSKLVAFIATSISEAPGTNPMIAPMLSKVRLTGTLDGLAKFDINPSNLPQSEGDLSLQLTKAVLTIDDPALNLAEQIFEKAEIKAGLKGGVFSLSDTSGFRTQGLNLVFSGSMKLLPELGRSPLDMNINLKLDKVLKDQFGFILDMAGGSDGAVKVQVKGTLDQPSVATI